MAEANTPDPFDSLEDLDNIEYVNVFDREDDEGDDEISIDTNVDDDRAVYLLMRAVNLLTFPVDHDFEVTEDDDD